MDHEVGGRVPWIRRFPRSPKPPDGYYPTLPQQGGRGASRGFKPANHLLHTEKNPITTRVARGDQVLYSPKPRSCRPEPTNGLEWVTCGKSRRDKGKLADPGRGRSVYAVPT